MGAPISTASPQQQPTGKGGGQQPQFGQPNQYANTVGSPMKQPFGFQSDIGTPLPQNFDQPAPSQINAGPQGGWDNAGLQSNQQPQRSAVGKGGKGQSSWQPFQSNSNWNQ